MTDLSQTRAWQIEALLASSRPSSPFASDLGQVFAGIPVHLEGTQVVPLQSPAYRNWLLTRFHIEHSVVPRPSALRDAVQALQAQVEFPAEPDPVTARPTVARRIASRPGQVLIDLHNSQGEAIEIKAQGWRITQNLTGYFRAARSARPLPPPEQPTRSSTFSALQQVLGLTPQQFTPCLSWLIAALSPTGPYPILVLQGPSSSAKSAVARMLRAIIDPGPAPFCPLPSSARDLQSLASHNWIVALDNVDLLPTATLRKLIRLSTGLVFAARDSSSDPEPFHFHLERPLVFTTETALSPNLGLRDRAIFIELPANAEPVSQLDFDRLRPQLLGALCNAVSAILAGDAAHPIAPPWRKFTGSPDPIATAVASFMAAPNEWTGTATELLLRLREHSPTLAWPETPKGLTQLLQKAALHDVDFQSLQNRDGTRSVILKKLTTAKTCEDAQQSPPAAAIPTRVAPFTNGRPNRIGRVRQLCHSPGPAPINGRTPRQPRKLLLR